MSVASRLASHAAAVPPLENGDRLTNEEFQRRYDTMPGLKKAELIEGVVYMSSPVSTDEHGEPHGMLTAWLGAYRSLRPDDVQFSENGTVRLDEDNNYQPDVLLRYRQGTSRNREGFIEGPPELVAEISASSASIDLHLKKNVYRRNRVQEYIAWRVRDGALDWWQLRNGEYVPLEPDGGGIIESHVFPGLRLHVPALLDGDLLTVLQTQLGQ